MGVVGERNSLKVAFEFINTATTTNFFSQSLAHITKIIIKNIGHLLYSVACAGFFNGRVSVTSHRDDVKILHCNCSSLEVLKCIAL